MASVFILRRKTAAGKLRYRVFYRLGGRHAPKHYAGTFDKLADADKRVVWVKGEIASNPHRLPNVGMLEEVTAPTLATAAAAWLAERINVAKSTQEAYTIQLYRALPILGKRRIDSLTVKDINKLILQLHDDGHKRGTIRLTVKRIGNVLRANEIEPNPALELDRLVYPYEEQTEVSPPEASHIEAACRLLGSANTLGVLFLEWSGARLAAIDKTLVDDYDEPGRRILLRRETTKTKKPLWIDLPDVLAEAISASLGPREDRNPAARLFSGIRGGRALRVAITRACTNAGVPQFTPHGLRHRRISLLHKGGLSFAEIGQLVGKETTSDTADRYTHVLFDYAEVDYAALLHRSSR